MAKTYGVCKLCGAKKMLNYAYLCKRCNKLKAGTEILEQALEKQADRADAAEAQAELAEEQAQLEEAQESETSEGNASDESSDEPKKEE